MTFRRYLGLSASHPDDGIRMLAAEYGHGFRGESSDDVRRDLLPWADYDQLGALDRAVAEWRAICPDAARHERGLL